MDRQLFALSLGFLACILLANHARAQEAPRCAPRAVIEVYASDATRTFSILATLPDGRACLIAAGDNFTPMSPEPPGDPA